MTAIERQGNDLVIKGKIFGTMPMTAKLRPAEARSALKLLGFRKALSSRLTMLLPQLTGRRMTDVLGRLRADRTSTIVLRLLHGARLRGRHRPEPRVPAQAGGFPHVRPRERRLRAGRHRDGLEPDTGADAVSRVIQGVLTGIGFLGAGVIFSGEDAGQGGRPHHGRGGVAHCRAGHGRRRRSARTHLDRVRPWHGTCYCWVDRSNDCSSDC